MRILIRHLTLRFHSRMAVSYGMTETCGKIAMSLLPWDSPAMTAACSASASATCARGLLSLLCTSGRPFEVEGFEVAVFDPSGRRIPADGATVGEVWCRGPTVFKGYWRRPEANRTAFRAELGGADTEPWFCTGDLAIPLPNGYIRVVDRAKDMVLVGGELNLYELNIL